MEKIIKGHLVGFGSVRDMEWLKDDYYGEFTDAGMTEMWRSAYEGVPSKDECDRICAEQSWEVRLLNLKNPRYEGFMHVSARIGFQKLD